MDEKYTETMDETLNIQDEEACCRIAEKIKKIEPSYEMPKKAGCISFSDKKK